MHLYARHMLRLAGTVFSLALVASVVDGVRQARRWRQSARRVDLGRAVEAALKP